MNKRKYIYPILIVIVSIVFYYAEEHIDKANASNKTTSDIKDEGFYYLPSSTTGVVIVHDHYALSYSEKHEQAEWVAYELKKSHLSQNEFKRPYFEEDKKINFGNTKDFS